MTGLEITAVAGSVVCLAVTALAVWDRHHIARHNLHLKQRLCVAERHTAAARAETDELRNWLVADVEAALSPSEEDQ